MHLATDIIFGSWVILWLVWLAASFAVKRDITQKQGWWRRWWILRLVFALAVVGAADILFRLESPLHYLARSNMTLIDIGALLTFCGIALAIWARLYLGRNWSGSPSLKEEHELVTSGPYALVRHPIYTGILLAIFGSSLASPVWFIVLAFVSAMFIRRIGIEEKLMMQTFPKQYPDYKKRTFALVPWVW